MARLIFQLGEGKTVDFDLAAAVVTLGRSTSNDIVINNSWISSHHAKFERAGGSIEVTSLGTLHGIPLKEYKRVGGVYTVTDLDSHNGVMVNGKRVTSQRLSSGDMLAFGQLQALFEDAAPSSPDSSTGSAATAVPSAAPGGLPLDTPLAAAPKPVTQKLVTKTVLIPATQSTPGAPAAPPPLPPETAKTALASLQHEVALLEKSPGALHDGAVTGQDTDHSLACGLIQRIDQLEDLMAAGEKTLPGLAARLAPLHASLLELLRDHSIEPYTVTPGQPLDVATRKRITIVEPSPEGAGVTEIAEVFRPGYQFDSGTGDAPAVILRKAEVRTLRRPRWQVT